MKTNFYYQSHLRNSAVFLRRFFITMAICSACIPLYFGCPQEWWRCASVRLGLYAGLTFMLMSVLASEICERWQHARITVTDTEIISYGLFQQVHIPFSEITALHHVHFWFVWGSIFVKSKKKLLFLPFVLADSANLGQLIREKLRDCGKSGMINEPRFGRYLHAARSNDRVNERLFADIELFLTISIIAGIFNIAVTLGVWHLPALLALPWLGVGFIFPATGYVIAHGVGGLLDLDAQASARVNAMTGLLTCIVYFASGTAYRMMFF